MLISDCLCSKSHINSDGCCKTISATALKIEEGAALVFDAEDAGIYNLWVAEPLPTYGAGQDAGGPLRYRAHLDCDVCRSELS